MLTVPDKVHSIPFPHLEKLDWFLLSHLPRLKIFAIANSPLLKKNHF